MYVCDSVNWAIDGQNNNWIYSATKHTMRLKFREKYRWLNEKNKTNLSPLLTHWSSVLLALTHRIILTEIRSITRFFTEHHHDASLRHGNETNIFIFTKFMLLYWLYLLNNFQCKCQKKIVNITVPFRRSRDAIFMIWKNNIDALISPDHFKQICQSLCEGRVKWHALSTTTAIKNKSTRRRAIGLWHLNFLI